MTRGSSVSFMADSLLIVILAQFSTSGTHLGLVDAVPEWQFLARSGSNRGARPANHFLRWLHRDAGNIRTPRPRNCPPQSANFVASGLTAKGSGDRSRII